MVEQMLCCMKYFYKYKLNYIAGIVKALDSYKIADLEKGIKDQEWKNHHTCNIAYSIIVRGAADK